MENQLRVVALVGSLRRASYTRRFVNALKELAPNIMTIELTPIDGLPLYNEDLDLETPPATPEYNRSIPGALKNAIDVGSRSGGASVWSGKPAAVLSASPGLLGGFGANHHIRQCLTFLDMPVMQQPEAYLGRVDFLIDDNGRIVARETAEFLERFVVAFEQWIRRLQVVPALESKALRHNTSYVSSGASAAQSAGVTR